MSKTFVEVMRYCLHCEVKIASVTCPRCGRMTDKTPSRDHRRRVHHAPEGSYLPVECHVSEDLWRIRRQARRVEIGYSEE